LRGELSRRPSHAGTWRERVENAIAPLLPHSEATPKNVARKLGVSGRTLARLLADEDTTFSSILSSLRSGLAERYLAEAGLGVGRIAWLLGYKDTSAFSHAFKRWNGRAPTKQGLLTKI